MELSVESLLKRLENTPAVDLLEAYDHTEYEDLWEKDDKGPRLFRTLSRTLVYQGFTSLALKLARRGLEAFGGDAALNYNIALAYARGGNLSSAEQVLGPLLDVARGMDGDAETVPGRLRMEIVALRGRLYKDRCRREKNLVQKKKLAGQAAEWYERAIALVTADPFPLINTATMRFVAGDKDSARSLAAQASEEATRLGDTPSRSNDYWLKATIGEACVILGDHEKALPAYRSAADLALSKGAIGDVVSILGNLRLLAEAGASTDPQWLQERLGSVVVFSGHMIDPPHRGVADPPRFPNDPGLTNRVKSALRERLHKLNARFGFTSLAAGSDILFAEAMLEREAELHVILPFAREDFLLTSVDLGQAGDARWQNWRTRFDAVLSQLKPDHLHFATTEPYLGTELLYDYANTFLQGLAVVRARQCLIDPVALVILDPVAKAISGGTRDFLDRWRQSGLRDEVIDLAALRGEMPAPRVSAHAPATRPQTAEMPRVVRAMLFADVAGFSKMNEECAPRFFRLFPQAVARVLEESGERVLLANTWGDGFFAVFENVADCAGFALDMLERVGGDVDWPGMGFPEINPLRVGLHAGPVFELANDPILRRRNYFGQHVNRAARIEPVTMPGCAFASEQFAALLAREAAEAFRTELIGVERLPKKSGVVALYRISRP